MKHITKQRTIPKQILKNEKTQIHLDSRLRERLDEIDDGQAEQVADLLRHLEERVP